MVSENAKGVCWSCGSILGAADYTREGRCPSCDKATHVCRNCRFYAPGRPNDCIEPIAEYVQDKQRPNFCDYLEPSQQAYKEDHQPSVDNQLQAAEDLFKP